MTRGIDGTSPDACVLQVLGRAACRGPARRWCRSARPLATLLPIASAGSVSRLPHAMCGLCQRGGRRRPPSPRSAHAAPDVTLAMGAGAAVPSPTVTGPITGGRGKPSIASTSFDLAQVGYEQAEYFISGTASAHTNAGTFGFDGKWTVARGGRALFA